MDWFLSVTTLFVNAGLGWWKGARWIWLTHAANATLWVVYSVVTKQYGFLLLSVVTIGVDLVSAHKAKRAPRLVPRRPLRRIRRQRRATCRRALA